MRASSSGRRRRVWSRRVDIGWKRRGRREALEHRPPRRLTRREVARLQPLDELTERASRLPLERTTLEDGRVLVECLFQQDRERAAVEDRVVERPQQPPL